MTTTTQQSPPRSLVSLRTFLLFCIAALLALTYAPPRTSTAQQGAHPSLWLATANNLQRVGATDSSPSLTLPIGLTSAVAVDRARALVWTHANGQLRAFNLDGQVRVNVTITTATGDSAFKPGQVIDLHISRDGTVWLSTLRRVYGFAPDGAFLRQITPPETLTALALDD